jgi:hypothetical protein
VHARHQQREQRADKLDTFFVDATAEDPDNPLVDAEAVGCVLAEVANELREEFHGALDALRNQLRGNDAVAVAKLVGDAIEPAFTG